MKWINVKDRLPEDSHPLKSYLIVVKWRDENISDNQWKSYTTTGIFNEHQGLFLTDEECLIEESPNDVVTHWMPLPEPPKHQ